MHDKSTYTETGAKLLSGLAGAAALTAVHELGRHTLAHPPRMDIYGRRVLARGIEALGATPPSRNTMYYTTLAGDVVSNGIFYALLAATGRNAAQSLTRGAISGMLAGVGAVVLPPLLGLGQKPSNDTGMTRAMTIAYYTLGGVAAAAVYRLIERE